MPRKIRPIRIEGNIAYVPLTKGYEAVIDAEDVPLVAGRNWHACVDGRSVYAAARTSKDGKRKTLQMHAVITGFRMTDHRDCDGLNNRRGNLREATRKDNAHNQRLSLNSTSRLKGACFDRANRKWKAHIRVDGRKLSLGYFETAQEAHQAYCRAAAKTHGEFSRAG